MPPCTPPELFVAVRIFRHAFQMDHCAVSRAFRVAANPEPISKPFVAGMLSIAFARSASSLSKQVRRFRLRDRVQRHSITPPIESPSSRTCSMSDIILLSLPRRLDSERYFSPRPSSLQLQRLIFGNDVVNLRYVGEDLKIRVTRWTTPFSQPHLPRPRPTVFARRRAATTLPVSDSGIWLVSVVGM